MFYFHGMKGTDFALVSDANLQINGHLIATRPQGRARDFTWVQALAVLFDSNTTLLIAPNHVALRDDHVDALSLRWNGRDIPIPTGGYAEWTNYEGGGVGRTGGDGSEGDTDRGGGEPDVRV
ncbi:hypothetical protein J5N97_007416 [Dioscorea zingiberensis]|uniref:Uncharacterized protein n=1 Tax=Dioscorea zingiberensis TaxID=325984 RepID=A0A9D5DC89_9LILI|nr:hypothetical protein J5N97_007416 [Dioscorea zingiberensis]